MAYTYMCGSSTSIDVFFNKMFVSQSGRSKIQLPQKEDKHH